MSAPPNYLAEFISAPSVGKFVDLVTDKVGVGDALSIVLMLTLIIGLKRFSDARSIEVAKEIEEREAKKKAAAKKK